MLNFTNSTSLSAANNTVSRSRPALCLIKASSLFQSIFIAFIIIQKVDKVQYLLLTISQVCNKIDCFPICIYDIVWQCYNLFVGCEYFIKFYTNKFRDNYESVPFVSTQNILWDDNVQWREAMMFIYKMIVTGYILCSLCQCATFWNPPTS